jgi:hypothetical protein
VYSLTRSSKYLKELVKESSRAINKMRREFQREMGKVEMNNNKIRFDIKKMVDRKEPRVPIFLNFFDLPVLVKY